MGFQYIRGDKAVASLVLLMAFVCFFMGFVQMLMGPMVLPLGSAKTVGIMESVSAMGMLIGTGEGRGIGLMIILAGISMVIMAFILGNRNSI